jgi:drug/metabolite transporter (DMT)-like permease
VIAALILLPFVARKLISDFREIRKHFVYLFFTAFFGVTMCNTLVYVAAETSNAINLSLIAICSPALTILFARLFLGDTLTTRRSIGILTVTSGVILLITKGELHRLMQLKFATGDLWMLGQAVSFAFYSILVRKKPEDLDPHLFLFSLFVIGMLVLLPWLNWSESVNSLGQWPSHIIGSIIYLGIGPSLLAFLLWNNSVAIIGPSRAALIYYTIPLFSGVAGLIFLGEAIRIIHLVSGILILGGVMFATKE